MRHSESMQTLVSIGIHFIGYGMDEPRRVMSVLSVRIRIFDCRGTKLRKDIDNERKQRRPCGRYAFLLKRRNGRKAQTAATSATEAATAATTATAATAAAT